MSLCGTVHAPGRACVSPVSSRVMHMWLWVPCKFYQRDQLLTGRAGVSSWPSHRALSAGVLECSGMWGSDRWERSLEETAIPDRSLHHISLPPPSCSFPLVFPALTASQETSIFFSLLAGEEEGRQTGETGWFNMRLSPGISFYFPPLGNFLPPSDKLSLDTIVPTHGEIFPHSSPGAPFDGFRGGEKKNQTYLSVHTGAFNQPHQTVRRLFLSRLNWKSCLI